MKEKVIFLIQKNKLQYNMEKLFFEEGNIQ